MNLNLQAPPKLDIDELMAREFQRKLGSRQVAERLVAYNLCLHLESQGFKLVSVDDGEEALPVSNIKEGLELLFNLDEAQFFFKKDGHDDHLVFFVLGNSGIESIADWSFYQDDRDGFNAAMTFFTDMLPDSDDTLFATLFTEGKLVFA